MGRSCLGWQLGHGQHGYGRTLLSEGGIVLRHGGNHIATSTVENVGSLKCRAPAGEALVVMARCSELVGAAGTSSVGMTKAFQLRGHQCNNGKLVVVMKVISERLNFDSLIYFNMSDNINTDENG